MLAATILFIATNAGPDRHLAPVVVAGRAPPAAEPLLAPAPALPHAVVHDRVLLDPRGAADPAGRNHAARQPLLVRRDAVVHDRARRGRRAALQRPRPRAPLPDAVERAHPRAPDPADGGARSDRHVRGVVRGRRPARRGAHDRDPLDAPGDGRLLRLSPPSGPRPAQALPHRAPRALRPTSRSSATGRRSCRSSATTSAPPRSAARRS